MKTVKFKLSKLIPYDANPRINDHAVGQLADAIGTYGFVVPMLVKRNGEIVDGHLRWKAAKRLGLKEVPCIVVDHLDEGAIKALRVNINRMAELAEWDMDALRRELAEIDAVDPSLDTGFDVATMTDEDEAAVRDVVERILSESEHVDSEDFAEEAKRVFGRKIDMLRRKSPVSMSAAVAIVVPTKGGECFVLSDPATDDVVKELRRYAEDGMPSPLAELMRAVVPLRVENEANG